MLHKNEISCNSNASMDSKINLKSMRYDFEGHREPDFIIVWETAVSPLTETQRITFFVLTIIVVIVALIGNALVLYVNFSRKQRLLFRTCLISVALSDLIYTQVTAMLYLPKMFISQSALWLLGSLACAVIPFLQTLAVLVNSILLVCIAMDRYMAVVRVAKSNVEPGKLFCFTCCVLIWGLAAGVSSPMLTIYEHYRIYIVPLPDDKNSTLGYYAGHVCASNKDENAYYFSIIFSFIFSPLVLTFLWMNSVVARDIWNRRRLVTSTTTSSNASSSSSSSSTSSTSSPKQLTTKAQTTADVERMRRQVRLFKIILLLMCVFFICRLPSWIYMIYKLNNSTDLNFHWILNYSFGILVLLNCALNPYLYTFMSETIRLVSFLGNVIRMIFHSLCKCGFCKRNDENFVSPIS